MAGVALALGLYLSNVGRSVIRSNIARMALLLLIAIYPTMNFGVGKKDGLLTKYLIRYTEVVDVNPLILH
jgi:hypothetical protein